MGDLNQLSFIRTHMDRFKEPFLEIGTKYGPTQSIRELFPDSDYTGLDMEDGPGVDVVMDLTQNFNSIHKALGGKSFNTIFCLSVLEHCSNPFLMCENMTRLLNRDGVLYVSVPFSWKFHEYPSDYWRFTPEGIRLLFPQLRFSAETSNLSTSEIGDLRSLDKDLCRIRFSFSDSLIRKKYRRAVTIVLIKLMKRFGVASWIFKYPYLLPPVMVNMLGIKG